MAQVTSAKEINAIVKEKVILVVESFVQYSFVCDKQSVEQILNTLWDFIGRNSVQKPQDPRDLDNWVAYCLSPTSKNRRKKRDKRGRGVMVFCAPYEVFFFFFFFFLIFEMTYFLVSLSPAHTDARLFENTQTPPDGTITLPPLKRKAPSPPGEELLEDESHKVPRGGSRRGGARVSSSKSSKKGNNNNNLGGLNGVGNSGAFLFNQFGGNGMYGNWGNGLTGTGIDASAVSAPKAAQWPILGMGGIGMPMTSMVSSGWPIASCPTVGELGLGGPHGPRQLVRANDE